MSAKTTKLPTIERRARLTEEERAAVGGLLAKAYAKGASVREIAEQTGRSYGATHRLLYEAGVKLRGRGGNTRKTS